MPPDNIFDGLLADFSNAAFSYYPTIWAYGFRILLAVIFVQICFLTIQAAMRRDLIDMMYTFMYGLVRIGLIRVIFDNLLLWANGFITTGQQIGQNVAGFTMTPSGVYNLGLQIVQSLYTARKFGMWLHPIDDIALLLICILTQITFALVALIYVWTLLEAIYHVIKGPIVLCWTPFDATWDTLLRWGERLIGLTIKIMSTLLMLAVGITLTGKWAMYLNSINLAINDHRIYYATLALVESLAYLAGVFVVPRAIASNMHMNFAGSAGVTEQGSQAMVETTKTVAGAGLSAASGGAAGLGTYVQSKLR